MERVLAVGTGVFISGYWFFPDGFWHLVWFVAAVAVPAALFRKGAVFTSLRRDPLAWLLVLWMMVLLGVSLARGAAGVPWVRRLWTPMDMALLVVFVAVCSHLAPRWGRRWLTAYVAAGVGAVAISFPWYYGVTGNPFPSARLRDMFVYSDGLHPVLTGLMCGAGAVMAAALSAYPVAPETGSASRWGRGALLLGQAVLLLGCFYTHSRGAMLATGAAFAVLPVVAGFRRALPPWGVLLAAVAFYQFASPHLGALSAGGAPSGGPASSPAAELVGRADAGRFPLYRHLLGQREGPGDHLIGRGIWAPRSAAPPDIHWVAPHPHSVYLSAYLYGGAVGLAMVAVLVAGALWRGISPRRPSAAACWGCPFVFGLVGLAFDGDSLVTIWTVPRLEPLLFWLPWAAVSGAWRAHGASAVDAANDEGKVVR